MVLLVAALQPDFQRKVLEFSSLRPKQDRTATVSSMSSFLFDALHKNLGNVLDLRDQQHGLTVSNLANADTPGYEAREMDFSTVLATAMEAGDDVNLRRTREDHFGSAGVSGQPPEIHREKAAPWAEDGNSVNAEREMSKLNANQLMYTAVVRGISRRLALLRYAAGDGK